MVFDLTNGQRDAKANLLSMIESRSDADRFATLSGPAGSGKSTVTVELLKSIPKKFSIAVCATTHKAVKVINKMMIREGIEQRCDVGTIHSKLGLKMMQKGGEKFLERDSFAKVRRYDILFVDEASMCDDVLLQFILTSSASKVIFIGDEYQISPVESDAGEVSKVFTEVDTLEQLTEVVRHDNAIINLATGFRAKQDEAATLGTFNFPAIATDLDEDGEGVEVVDGFKWFADALEIFSSEEFKENPDIGRCIAFTNAQVKLINESVRERIHGADAVEYLVGEVLVAQDMKMDAYNNSEELTITSVDEDFSEVHEMAYWNIGLKSNDTGQHCDVRIVKGDDVKIFESRLADISHRALVLDKGNSKRHWKAYWALKSEFASFKYVYCMTAHKSQGSTFEQTFVYTPDFIKFGPSMEILQLLYTATTRSSKKTIFALN